MANIFEEIMKQSQPVTESFVRNSNKKVVKTESKRIAADKIKLESRRIFEEVDDLDELDDQFEVTPEDVDDEENENEVVLVIDPEADPDEEIPEDAANEMIGDEVYKCPVCGANYLCSHDAIENESIEVDEEGVPVECPVCGDDTDQILIGEIAPVDGAGEETDLDMVDSEDAEDDIDVDDVDVDIDEEIPDEEEFVEEEDDEVIEDSLKRSRSRKRRTESKSLRRGRRGRGKKFESKDCPECDEVEDEETLTEDVDDDIDLVDDYDDDDIDVVDEVDDSLEFVDPVVEDKASAVNIQKADTVELHFDEARLESMMTDMLRENYKGKGTFRVRNITSKDNKLKFEYVVRTNKISKRGTLVAEGFIKSNRKITLRCRDKGAFTESFTRTPSFVIECVRIRNKIIPVSVKYDFKKRVNESLYRVKGEAGKSVNFTKAARRK